ncbi:MAG: hypothetical protein ACFCU6_11830 [Balneolaceae bacterium]
MKKFKTNIIDNRTIFNIAAYSYISIILLFTLVLLSCSKSNNPYSFLTVEISEQKNERIIKEPLSEKVFQDSNFLFPVLMEVSDKGLFVLDIADNAKIKRFNWDFNLIKKIGRGIGPGPGEFGGVSDIHLSELLCRNSRLQPFRLGIS